MSDASAPRRFRHVAVLLGGPSSEREISLRSGAAIASALTSRGYDVTRVDPSDRVLDLPPQTDAAFIALHGEFGEDGEVQALLEARGIPFTGPGSEASRTAFDKMATKRALEAAGLPTAAWEILREGDPRTLPLPVVVKPPRQGSSIGIAAARTEADWPDAFSGALAYDREILVEAFVAGRELTVGVVGDEVFPIVEIRAPGGNYDFTAKYTKGMTEYLCPAPLPEALAARIRAIGLATFRAVGCRGLGRVDVRVDEAGNPFVLEINTIPGFTETSLLPKAAAAAGIGFADLCERVLGLATC